MTHQESRILDWFLRGIAGGFTRLHQCLDEGCPFEEKQLAQIQWVAFEAVALLDRLTGLNRKSNPFPYPWRPRGEAKEKRTP